MRALSAGVRRAREDLREGRLWKARDRLRGVVGAHPTDQEALELLGEVHLRMGDAPEAGRWLVLTERDDEAARDAVAAFRARFDLAQALRQIPAYAPIDAYPPSVAARLRGLQAEARAQGVDWAPRTRPRRRRPVGRDGTSAGPLGLGERVVLATLASTLVGPWLVGAVRIVRAALRGRQ